MAYILKPLYTYLLVSKTIFKYGTYVLNKKNGTYKEAMGSIRFSSHNHHRKISSHRPTPLGTQYYALDYSSFCFTTDSIVTCIYFTFLFTVFHCAITVPHPINRSLCSLIGFAIAHPLCYHTYGRQGLYLLRYSTSLKYCHYHTHLAHVWYSACCKYERLDTSLICIQHIQSV